MSSRKQSWVVVFVGSSRFDADVIAAALQSHGIEALVSADDTGQLSPDLALVNGVSVSVRDDQLHDAVLVINAGSDSAHN